MSEEHKTNGRSRGRVFLVILVLTVLYVIVYQVVMSLAWSFMPDPR